MDTTDKTPQPKTTRRLPGKKVMLLVLLIVLAAGAAGAYWYRQRSDSDSGDSSEQTDVDTNLGPTAPANPDDVKERYALTKRQLSDLDGLTDIQKASVYASAAFDGAVLDDPKAEDYAQTALDLYPDDEAFLEENKEFEGFYQTLVDISKGDYSSAKGEPNETAQELEESEEE